MTASARITQDDMTRATKAVKAAGFERARIIMDLAKAKIEVIIGDATSCVEVEQNPWDDE
jgi:hypothetical protein